MNRADGMIYHRALTRAAPQLGLSVSYFDKATILDQAASARGIRVPDLEQRLKALGTTLGPPWQKGHVIACAAAIVAHSSAAIT